MSVNSVTFVAPNLAWGEARGASARAPGASPGSGAVTDEQRSLRPNSAQPSGRRFFSAPAALLAPYRSAWDMLVARVLPGPKTPRRKRHRIYAHDHLGFGTTATSENLAACAAPIFLKEQPSVKGLVLR